MASKALLMSIGMSSVLFCGALWLKPSSMSCFICVINLLVECFGLKLCWVGDRGMCVVISFSMSHSMTLKTMLSSVMGLYEVTSFGSLLGLRMVPYFHVSVTLQCE